MVDVVDELTENEARQFEHFERRIKETEDQIEQVQKQKLTNDKKTSAEVRRIAAIVDSGKFSAQNQSAGQSADRTSVDVVSNDELRITMRSIQEKMNIIDDQIQENDESLKKKISTFKNDLEAFRDDQLKMDKREKDIDGRVQSLEKQSLAVPGRTVSLGASNMELTEIKNQIRELESQLESTRSEIESAESLKARTPRLDEMNGLGLKRTAICVVGSERPFVKVVGHSTLTGRYCSL